MQIKNAEEQKILDDWYNGLPEEVKPVFKQFPPGTYVVKEGSDYGVSCTGTKVQLIGYGSDTTHVAVVVLAKDKLPQAIEHERKLGELHNKTQEEIEAFHKANVQVTIETKYLEKVEDDEMWSKR